VAIEMVTIDNTYHNWVGNTGTRTWKLGREALQSWNLDWGVAGWTVRRIVDWNWYF
jgi:hypothetical protein